MEENLAEVDDELSARLRRGVVDRSPDLITAFDATGTVRFVNDSGLAILGWARHEVVGRSFIDFLHPDEVERAVALATANLNRMQGPRGGAPYRLRRADGGFETLDVSVTVVDGLLVVVGRRMYDHELMARVLDGLTSNEPFADIVALLPAFDWWRNPTEPCVLRCHGDDGDDLVVGAPLPDVLTGADPEAGSPWGQAIATSDEVVVTSLGALPPAVAVEARARCFTGCRVRAVVDPRGHPPALITVWATDAGPPIEARSYPMATIARTLGLVLRFHRDATDLRHAATHDQLTGLRNRAGFFAELPADRVGTPVTVLALDLDGFKPVNDRLGHAAGDAVLRHVAARLVEVVGPDHLTARLGGDEFVVVVVGDDDRAAADALAARLGHAVSQPVHVAGEVVQIEASIGIAVDPGTARSIDELLAEADVALYRAKERTGTSR